MYRGTQFYTETQNMNKLLTLRLYWFYLLYTFMYLDLSGNGLKIIHLRRNDKLHAVRPVCEFAISLFMQH